MTHENNELGQPIGQSLADWTPAGLPTRMPLTGRFCTLLPVDVDLHAQDLFDAFRADREDRIWTYLPYGPFENIDDLHHWLTQTCLGRDPFFHAIIDHRTGTAAGLASFLRIEPKIGVIEVGHINYAPQLQRSAAATEAMFLLMCTVFNTLGYRRYEWKCDALNAPSRAAAKRLGFTFEGIFRQATIYKQRNRDTAWFSILDSEWPALMQAYEKWLQPENFDGNAHQKQPLGNFMPGEGARC